LAFKCQFAPIGHEIIQESSSQVAHSRQHDRAILIGRNYPVEVAGHSDRHIEHATTIRELLVPRLVDGLTLPIIVHPNEPDRIEVQWHLV